jgi:hypothetical protein
VTNRPELPLYVLAAIGIAAIAVVIATGHAVPVALYGLVAAVLAGGLGLTVPAAGGSAAAVSLEDLAAPVVDAVRAVIHDLETSQKAATAAASSPAASTSPATVSTAETAVPAVSTPTAVPQ